MRIVRCCAVIVAAVGALLVPGSAHAFDLMVTDYEGAAPTGVTIDTVAGVTTVTPTVGGATMRDVDLESLLGSANVVVDAGNGRIDVRDGVSIAAGRTLTLRGGHIEFDRADSMTVSPAFWSGPGDLVVDSSGDFRMRGATYLGHLYQDFDIRMGAVSISANNAYIQRAVRSDGPQIYDARVVSDTQFAARSLGGDVTFNEGVQASNTSATFYADAGVTGDVTLNGGFGSTRFASITIGADNFYATATTLPSSDVTMAAKWTLTGNSSVPLCGSFSTAFAVSGAYAIDIPGGCSTGWYTSGSIDVASINHPFGEFVLIDWGLPWLPPTVRGASSVNLDLVRGPGKLQSDGTIRVRRFGPGADVTLESPGDTRLELDAIAAPAKITTDTPGTNTLGGTLNATGSVTLAGASTLADATTFGGTAPVSISSLAGGAKPFTTSTTGGTTIGAASGTFGPISLGGSGVSLAGSMHSNSTVIATAPLTLTGDTSLASVGALTLTSNINGAHDLTTSGPTRFGSLGNVAPLASVDATGATRLSNDVRVTGALDVAGALTLDADVDVEAGELDVTGTVDLGSDAAMTHVLDGAGSFSGGMVGLGSLRKEGTGELVIGGTTTNTGRIVVAEGSVRTSTNLTSLSEIELAGGTLTGTGRLPDIRGTDGTIRPGVSGVGTLPIGAARLTAGTTLEIGIGSGTPAILDVTGSVDLDGAILTLSGDPANLAVGATHVIVANNGSDPISQTFAGIGEDEIVTLGPDVRVAVSYQGGSLGNDVTIRRIGSSTTQLEASAASSRAGEGVTLTATVTGASSSPGDVRFYDGVVVMGAATPVDGIATLLVTDLAAGVHALSARYGGDAETDPSSSAPVSHTIIARAVVVLPTPVIPTPIVPVVPEPLPLPDIDTTAPRLLVVVARPVPFTRKAQPAITVTLRCESTETSCTHSILAETSERARGRTRWVELGEDDVTVPGGATRVVKLRLNAAAKSRLARTGKLVVRLELTVADTDENAATAMRSVTLKLRSGR